ncbi:hypothetical protein [Kitasatospora sp. NPDC050543]
MSLFNVTDPTAQDEGHTFDLGPDADGSKHCGTVDDPYWSH